MPAMSPPPTFPHLTITTPHPTVYMITMNHPPENRLTIAFAQSIISALRWIESNSTLPISQPPNNTTTASKSLPGLSVILTSASPKFFCTGVSIPENASNPYASNDGFYPLLATLLDVPFPTIALITGHTFGGGSLLSLACDYRVMNSERGFWCMPAIDLGLHFDGIGSLIRLKLGPRTARRVLLEGRRFTGLQACEEGIVDEMAAPGEIEGVAVGLAREQAGRATAGVYSLLRGELCGEALEKLRKVSYARGRRGAARAPASKM